jgi:glycosyltransferase involved in cell wall biosynthesis
MDILHLYKDYYPVLGGIENHIRVLAEAQADAGHRVTVLVCDPGHNTHVDTLNGVQVIMAGRLTTAASMPLSLRQPLALARLRPDVVHIHSPYPLGELANLLLRRARATVITHHSDVVRQRGWLRLYAPFLRRVLRAAERIIATSPRYIETSPWLRPVRDKCTVVPLGVDPVRFSPPVEARGGRGEGADTAPLQADLDLRRGESTETAPLRVAAAATLLFTGRLRYYKGLDTLFQALSRLPDVQLLIVGDGPMREDWERMVDDLHLAQRVTFAGEVPDEDLPGYYHGADVFVLPANARAEAFGTVLLEAMASGLPCVTTEVGTGTSWVVQDGVTGLVVPPRDPQALTNAIRSLLDDPQLRLAMGRAARARVEEEFTTERMIARVHAVYEEVLET